FQWVKSFGLFQLAADIGSVSSFLVFGKIKRFSICERRFSFDLLSFDLIKDRAWMGTPVRDCVSRVGEEEGYFWGGGATGGAARCVCGPGRFLGGLGGLGEISFWVLHFANRPLE